MTLRNNLLKQVDIKPFQPHVTEEHYFVHPKLKRDFDGIMATLKNIDDFGTEMGDRNYILTGSPGTGKTLGVMYIATCLGFPVYDGKTVMTAQTVAGTFSHLREQAKKKPLILIVNELDKYSSREELVDPGQQQTLNQLLDELDGTESNHGIFIFGTTNKPNALDPALRRPKRFSKEVYFMPPDKDGRLAILKIHAKGKGGHKFVASS